MVIAASPYPPDLVILARRAVVDSMEDGVIVIDAQMHVVDVNRSAEDILDQSSEDLIGQPVAQVLSNWPDLGRLIRKMDGSRTETDWGQGEEQRVLDIRVSPLQDQDDHLRGCFLILRDVTERRQSARDLKKAKDVAEAANEAKSVFMSVASHEMRTPITCIRGYTDLLARGTAGPVNDFQGEFLRTIRINADWLARLVSDLSDIARIETGRIRLEFSSVAVDQVIREAIAGIQPHLDEKEQELTLRVPGDLPRVRGDHDRLVQVLTNLLSNAHKFTPPRGQITVVAECLGDECGGERIHLAVEDNGVGIAPGEQKLVFEKFYRSDDREVSEVSGSGLGLSIAKKLVEMQGGQIWLESTFREGTAVHITLPVRGEP
jgi:PAS domain S-box-containing protein